MEAFFPFAVIPLSLDRRPTPDSNSQAIDKNPLNLLTPDFPRLSRVRRKCDLEKKEVGSCDFSASRQSPT
jgi:hypothetical protein